MNGNEDFQAGERFAKLESNVELCLTGIEEIKNTIVKKVEIQHDDILEIKSEISLFKKIFFWILGTIVTPMLTGLGIFLWQKLSKH